MNKAFIFHRNQALILLTMILSHTGNIAIAQVINDNIENRIELILNQPVSSNTTDCTLQWNCLEHKQSKKLIQYHNDQWFFFKTAEPRRHFINISAQECRDIRGVQLMVIDGPPCSPDEYKILNCVSLGTQDDIFITLDSLSTQREYLILIDGYLNDFCAFQIEISDKPKGIPFSGKRFSRVNVDPVADYHFEISWSIEDSLAQLIKNFKVYRRGDDEFKSTEVHNVQQGFNAFGEPRLDYMVDEFLPDYGVYYYQIVGLNDYDNILLSKFMVQHKMPKQKISEWKNWIELNLTYPSSRKLKISIYDNYRQSLLYWTNFHYNEDNSIFEHYIKEYHDDGTWSFRIEVEDLSTNEKKNHLIVR